MTSRSNLTILEQNTLLGFEHDDTQDLYLRGAQRDEIKALKCASEWQHMLRPFLMIVPDMRDDVMEFIRERQFRRYFPNQ